MNNPFTLGLGQKGIALTAFWTIISLTACSPGSETDATASQQGDTAAVATEVPSDEEKRRTLLNIQVVEVSTSATGTDPGAVNNGPVYASAVAPTPVATSSPPSSEIQNVATDVPIFASAPAPSPIAVGPATMPTQSPVVLSPTPPPAPVASVPVNHAGRVLSTMPSITSPVMFNTPAADAILTAMQIMPKDSAWNEDIGNRPVHPDSTAMIARIGAGASLKFNYDMNFIIVPPNQPKVNVVFTLYGDESDPGPYPIPDQTPIEDWPIVGGDLQTHQTNGTGDRHAIVVDPLNQKIYEIGNSYKTGSEWQAAAGAVFDLNTNRLRPLGWTSSDAAGLPIFPSIVRYDELARGAVEHALRFTVPQTRRAYIYPATHYASNLTDQFLPAMGQRFRLKATANLGGLSPHALAIAKALQKYGMIVADNGGAWRISVAPDTRITGLNDLSRFVGSDFEVIQTTGEFEGPRAR